MTVVQAGIGPHIRVLIRTHHSHYELVQSLIWGMRYQGQEMNVTVDFVMIPTEPGSLVVLESFQKGTCDVCRISPSAFQYEEHR